MSNTFSAIVLFSLPGRHLGRCSNNNDTIAVPGIPQPVRELDRSSARYGQQSDPHPASRR
jgi:hypothetical protein